MKRTILIPFALCSVVCSGLSAQSVSLDPTGTWASGEVELDGLGMEAVSSASQPNQDLYTNNYGSITTGNTISRTNFIATMSQAFAGGYGGVYGFNNQTDVDSSDTYNELVFSYGSSGSVTVTPGPNNYVEGGAPAGYKGKETGNFDGTGPSPQDSARDWNIGTSGNKNFIGNGFLGNVTSFDMDFDPMDEVSVVGFAFLNYQNFQSFQRGNSDYPNMHVRATWTDGVDSITEMAVQFSAQDDPNDVYFGFQQPEEGYFLDGLAFYMIGNSGRGWVGADEFGLAVGDNVAVPEPGMSALLGGLGAALLLFWRRRQR